MTLIEGAFIWDLDGNNNSGDESGSTSKSRELIGQNVYDVFRSTKPETRNDEVPPWLKTIEDILTGKIMEDVHEHCIDNRWYRTRFVPVFGKKGDGGQYVYFQWTFVDPGGNLGSIPNTNPG